MTMVKQQLGSTLLVALVMLVLLTLIALSAIKSTTSSIQVVGNAQFREEAKAAAQTAIERVLSTPDFLTTPPAPQNIDVNQDGASDYTVSFAPAPSCIAYKAADPTDPTLPVVCGSSVGAVCFWTVWDIRAVVSDAQTGAGIVLHQGVRTIYGIDKALASCGT